MKKTLLTVATVSLLLSLAACGDNGSNPKPSPSPSSSASASPSASPDPSPSPSATPDPTPTPSQSALPTPTPDPNADLTLTGATATKQANFSYNFTINGINIGALADFDYLEIRTGPSTVPLVRNGVSQVNGVSLRSLDVTGSAVTFNWLPDNGAPTSSDLLQVVFDKKNDNQGRISTSVRLTVN